ncbi:hypothetical protein [Streptomyces swartbergensis]|uniref:hypothetical protein n=1 Tax=Streptomyces swartbergensis TaxID=487165 RepID=UPI0037F865DF
MNRSKMRRRRYLTVLSALALAMGSGLASAAPAAAQSVGTINTEVGVLTQNVTIQVSWTLL